LEDSAANPYLFRATERILFKRGAAPLSAVKDMIGSQATKGMHVVAKFARSIESCGVWTDGNSLTVLESYPSACRNSTTIKTLRSRFAPLDHKDKEDALTCALIANFYATQRSLLAAPERDIPVREGWIWVPKDSFPQAAQPTEKRGLP
jgi:predicted nuclease with RNAse H fold